MIDKNLSLTEFRLKRIEHNKKISKHNRNLILDFYHEKVASGAVKPKSLHYYLLILNRLGEFTNKDFEKLVKNELVSFFANLKPEDRIITRHGTPYKYPRDKYSECTLWLYKQSVKSFWKWIYEGKRVDRDRYGAPFIVSWIKGANKFKYKYEKPILNREEVLEMIKVSSNPRDKAIIAVLFEAGVRAGELLSMRKSKMTMNGDYCEFVVDGKTGERSVVIVKSYPYLSKWLTVLSKNSLLKSAKFEDHVWLSFPQIGTTHSQFRGNTKPLNHACLDNIVKRAGLKADIKKRIWVHGFRHSSATDFAKQGYNEVEMKLKYGWAPNSTIPSRYMHYKYDELRNKILSKHGKAVDEKPIDENMIPAKECPFCSHENPFDSEYCGKCAKPMDAKMIKESEKQGKALEAMQTMVSELKTLERKGFDVQQFNRFMESWVKENGKN